jgi:LasA protease
MRYRRIAFLILFLCLFPALACNYPYGHQNSTAVSPNALRQTLNAQEISPGSETETPAGQKTTIPIPDTASLPTSPSEPPTAEFDPLNYHYLTGAGDTLPSLALRFGVSTSQILTPQALPDQAYLPPLINLTIPRAFAAPPYPEALLPDSEVVYSPSTIDFSINDYVQAAGGFLASYQETIAGTDFSSAQIVQRVAQETSTNPRLLLAILEYRSGWLIGQPAPGQDQRYPLGLYVPGYQGLYKELSLIGKLLNIGYYGWRSGSLTDIKFTDNTTVRLSPTLNAGSVAIQYLFGRLLKQPDWQTALYGQTNFIQLYQELFGNPWERAARMGPLLPFDLQQPVLELPFKPGERWSLTAGPHQSWNTGTPLGALDFAPVTGESPCRVSRAWATASAPGLITRSGNNMVILDLDGDGFEQTGWVIFYFHVAEKDRIPQGQRVNLDDPIGHPSCEGGNTTGTHVHVARKYNGEWIPADGPLPFRLSGWTAHFGERAYQGSLTKEGAIVRASPGGAGTSIIIR